MIVLADLLLFVAAPPVLVGALCFLEKVSIRKGLLTPHHADRTLRTVLFVGAGVMLFSAGATLIASGAFRLGLVARPDELFQLRSNAAFVAASWGICWFLAHRTRRAIRRALPRP